MGSVAGEDVQQRRLVAGEVLEGAVVDRARLGAALEHGPDHRVVAAFELAGVVRGGQAVGEQVGERELEAGGGVRGDEGDPLAAQVLDALDALVGARDEQALAHEGPAAHADGHRVVAVSWARL
jgi:hypothetical protein